MKIAIDARGINWYKGTGIGTYTDRILSYMIKNHSENFYHIYWSGNKYDNFNKKNTKIIMASKKQHRFFEQYYFPENLKEENIDIYHVPQNGIGISENITCKKVITVHDLIPYIMPETVGRSYLTKFIKEMPRIINMADAIITVSEYSKKDILKFFPINKNKIFVTPLAADEKYKPLDKEICKNKIKSTYNIDKPFILYVGGFSPRKNVTSLIEAFSRIHKNLNKDYDLVIVGSSKDDLEKLKEFSSKLHIEENIRFTGFIKDDLLPVFYSGCDLFVYPSLYEGFGLPPLEAMSCGTPVITSNISSIPEVVGDGAILIDPKNIVSLMYSIESILNDDTIRNELSLKALNRSHLFSWENTCEKTIKIYNKILKT
ncbi:glycosyltransferase involved in cell wall biosynthesis [Clostridium algifaecis]|uniref:Glycosyltransferase involved in cell wall biosynthesis n=1 Tax=Clostridium algifaecis TaxID=1472040 RepID=A0ABS4KQN6_9CLOT|nr:glycosyltransferase family 1 protein [Clostridium algifaecis]MBP2032350.1 glycosyltransferase involved in cell wall biosynthesis [Clostridium algifaecis]